MGTGVDNFFEILIFTKIVLGNQYKNWGGGAKQILCVLYYNMYQEHALAASSMHDHVVPWNDGISIQGKYFSMH